MNSHGPGWDAVIVNYNGSLFLDPCLRALTAVRCAPNRIIVVDNASTDDSLLELNGWPQAEVIQSPENLGYSGGANVGVRASDSPIAVVLNPDVELDPEFGDGLTEAFSRDSRLGAAGAKLHFPGDNIIQHAGGVVNWPELTTRHRGEHETDVGQFDSPMDAHYVTGAAIAIRRVAFDSIRGFDESYFPAYWEDVDFCFRLRQNGWAVRYEPGLTGVHHEGSGLQRGTDYFFAWTRNRLRFAANHLSPREWWQDFLPAELERLRGEFSAIENMDWPIRSGAASIELFARSGSLEGNGPDTQLRAEQLVRSIEAIRELPGLADPAPPRPTPADGVTRRVKLFLSRYIGRFYAEEFYWQQRQFNESVVRAFEAQDRLNREVTVQLLLSLMLIARESAQSGSGGGHYGWKP